LKVLIIILLFFFSIFSIVTNIVYGDTKVEPTVMIDYTIDPGTLMPGDTATITIYLKNGADKEIVYVTEDNETKPYNMNAYILSAVLSSSTDITVLNSGYTDVGLLGIGDTIKLSFVVKADENAKDGTYFLNFELVGGTNMYDLNYKIPVEIDSSGVQLIASNIPRTVMKEVSTIKLDVVNTRSSKVNSVIVIPDSSDVAFNPSKVYVGNLSANGKATVSLNMNTMTTSAGKKNITFVAQYRTGNNIHNTSKINYVIDVIDQYGLILTSLDIKNTGSYYTITGDINNIGTNSARNVVISVEKDKDITPVQPDSSYFIGTLDSDDFSSFELSARINSSDVKSIPLVITFRNADNEINIYHESVTIERYSIIPEVKNTGMSTGVIAVVAIVALIIIGIIVYSWKKSMIKP